MKKNSEGVSERGNLSDRLKECTYCKESYVASVKNEVNSHFTAYKNQRGWYYYSYCKSCKSEYDRLKRKGVHTEEIKKGLREKRALERANRRWSIYKITINTDFMLDRIREIYTIWHNDIYYVGLTKQEAKQRWYEHLYDLRTNTHSNKLMQDKYNKIRDLYSELSDKDFKVLFETNVIKFEVITTLDNDMIKLEAQLYEKIEIKALENQLKRDVKEDYLQAVRDKKSIQKLIYTQNDVILNLEHCKSSEEYLNEIEKKITQSETNTRVIS
ncbi:hypothetical protein [Clostridium sp. CCUG 7971]|uniref:hypothetical protein n=1 Tax=Clostridium sp. CCUG 7971 TaxID=2811414 RepID=UPI001ABA84EC|nr:hypothetical protein [Clostridium sp. CCUG 7971]MBO3445694.1 hypothetical protein [Clostridium sp. CCUG 7971]